MHVPEASGLPLRAAAAFGVVFGLLTVFSGGMALFGGAAVGNAVPFVLWFNFLAGFAYVAASLGLFFRQGWAVWLSLAILLATFLVLSSFALHVATGGPFEMRTVFAMILRTGVWAGIAALAWRAPWFQRRR